MWKRLWILILCLSLLLLSACAEEQKEEEAIEALLFAPSYDLTEQLRVGEKSGERYFTVVTDAEIYFWDIEFISTDESVATVRYAKTAGDIYVYYTIEAVAAGEAYVYFTAQDGKVESERIHVTVIENVEKIEPEDTTPKDTEPWVTDSETVEPEGETTPESTEAPADTDEVRRVYVTPSGKRYHYSKSCAGKNAKETTMDEAIAAGKTPCGTCAKE